MLQNQTRHLKFILICVFFFYLFAFVSCENTVSSGKLYIVSCGLSYEKTEDASNLPGTIDDALEIGKALELSNADSSVEYMLDVVNYENANYASRENILEKIKKIKNKLSDNDSFIFYYSGHGILCGHFACPDCGKVNDAICDSESLNSFECTSCGSTNIKNVEYHTMLITGAENEESLFGHIEIEELYGLLESLPCHAGAILDICYSGEIVKYADNTSSTVFEFNFADKKFRKVISMSASSSLQESVVSVAEKTDGTYQQHGLFTVFLLKELGWEHNNDEFQVNLNEKKITGHGGLKHKNSGLTFKTAYKNIKSSWSKQNQTPQISGVVYDLKLVK